MTRDEAIERVIAVDYPPGTAIPCGSSIESAGILSKRIRNEAALHVDRAVALGVLKLDEPMTDEDKACRVLNAAIGPDSVDVVRSHLRGAGFKIVKA